MFPILRVKSTHANWPTTENATTIQESVLWGLIVPTAGDQTVKQPNAFQLILTAIE